MTTKNFASVWTCCLGVLLFPLLITAQAPHPDYTLVYEDTFDTNVRNESEWYYRDMSVEYLGGWDKKENVSVETDTGIGYLRIDYNQWDTNGDGMDEVVGGGVMTKKAFGYGYYEAKMFFYD